MDAIDELIKQSKNTTTVTVADLAEADIAALRAQAAERDAFAAENDAVHRAINEICGTDTSTIEAVETLRAQLQAAQAVIITLRASETGLRATITESSVLIDELNTTVAAQARQLEQAKNCITRRLRYHRNFPPLGSARWSDRESGIPGEDARECDCDYCIEDRDWLASTAPVPDVAPQPDAEQERTA